MSEKDKLMADDGELTENLEQLVNLANDYIRHVGGKFVFKYVYRLPDIHAAEWEARLQTYCYEFRLPKNVKFSIITDSYNTLECAMWYNYMNVTKLATVNKVIDMITKYLTDRVDGSLNKVLDSVAETLNDDIRKRQR
jgi:hypothetical protein